MKLRLSQEDLVVISKALSSYADHLQPSASYVAEISLWQRKVLSVRDKVVDIFKDKEVFPPTND